MINPDLAYKAWQSIFERSKQRWNDPGYGSRFFDSKFGQAAGEFLLNLVDDPMSSNNQKMMQGFVNSGLMPQKDLDRINVGLQRGDHLRLDEKLIGKAIQGVSLAPTIVGASPIDPRALVTGAVLTGAAKNIKPRYLGISQKISKIKTLPAPSTARKLVNITDDVDMPLPVTSKKLTTTPIKGIIPKYAENALYKISDEAMGIQRTPTGVVKSMAWTGTGRRVGGGLDGQDADPYIFKSGSAKGESGVTDGMSLRQKLASDMLNIVDDQTDLSITAVRKSLDNYRRKTTIENEKGQGQTWNGNQQFIEAVNKGERDVGVLAGLLTWSSKNSKSSAIRINLEKQPTREVRAWIKYRFPKLSDAVVDKLVAKHAKHGTVGFGRIRQAATKESLTPSDWMLEWKEGRILDKYERQTITSEMRKNAGHLLSVKSLLSNPWTEEIQAALATQGVNLERLHLPATTEYTGIIEDFLTNVKGSNLKEHDFNYHLAKLMGVPTSWADDVDIFLDRELGIGKRILWKENFNTKQMEKALTFSSSKSEAEALEFYNKEILPLTKMGDLKMSQELWEESLGISNRSHKELPQNEYSQWTEDMLEPDPPKPKPKSKSKPKPKYEKKTTTKKKKNRELTFEELMNKPKLTMKEKKLLHQKLTDRLYEGK